MLVVGWGLVKVRVSEYRPRPWAGLPVWLPHTLETQLRYLISLSGALALINLAPVYWLDGQWALTALLLAASTGPHRGLRLRRWLGGGDLLLKGTTGLLAANLIVQLLPLLLAPFSSSAPSVSE